MPKKQPVFETREECENHPIIKKAIKPGNLLDLRIPIFWLEMGKAETTNYPNLYALGEELFGSPNSVIVLRKIANAGTYKSGQFWIPIGACSKEAIQRAQHAFESNDPGRYSYAYNIAQKIGRQTMTVEQFAEKVKQSKRGGECAFYLMELKNGKGQHYWQTGIAGISENKSGTVAAMDRLRFQGDRMFDEERNKDKNASVRWRCLITDIANTKEANLLDQAAEATFGDICRLREKDGKIIKPEVRFGKKQFQNHPRMHEAARLLRPMTSPDLPESYWGYFD